MLLALRAQIFYRASKRDDADGKNRYAEQNLVQGEAR